jgi:hypothetical protein
MMPQTYSFFDFDFTMIRVTCTRQNCGGASSILKLAKVNENSALKCPSCGADYGNALGALKGLADAVGKIAGPGRTVSFGGKLETGPDAA